MRIDPDLLRFSAIDGDNRNELDFDVARVHRHDNGRDKVVSPSNEASSVPSRRAPGRWYLARERVLVSPLNEVDVRTESTQFTHPFTTIDSSPISPNHRQRRLKIWPRQFCSIDRKQAVVARDGSCRITAFIDLRLSPVPRLVFHQYCSLSA